MVTPVPAITINPIIATLVPLDTSLLGATQTSTPLVSLPNAQLTSSTAADVFDYAQLANDVYSDNANASGFKLATLVMKNVPGFMPVILLDNGLYANVYQRTKIINGVETVELVVGFRGSEPPAPNPLDLVDWASNFNQLIDSGLTTGQYVAAAKIVSDVTFAAIKLRQQGKNVTVTVVGHSLGGGLAQFASAMADGQVNKVITFNSAGLSAASLKQIGSSNLAALKFTNITHIITSGDPVHVFGVQLPGSTYSIKIPPKYVGLLLDPAYYHNMSNLLGGIGQLSGKSANSW